MWARDGKITEMGDTPAERSTASSDQILQWLHIGLRCEDHVTVALGWYLRWRARSWGWLFAFCPDSSFPCIHHKGEGWSAYGIAQPESFRAIAWCLLFFASIFGGRKGVMTWSGGSKPTKQESPSWLSSIVDWAPWHHHGIIMPWIASK